MPERFSELWADKATRDEAKTYARQYVAANRAELAALFESLTLQDIVERIDSYRQAGMERERIVADMWLLSEYEPQRISVSFNIGGGNNDGATV